MLWKKMALGALVCVGAALYGLDLTSASTKDVVTDQEAASVVGGDCPCIATYTTCNGCTGSGLCWGGNCGARADYLYNVVVCGCSCGGSLAAGSAGCGPGS